MSYRYTKIPTTVSKQQFAAALGIGEECVIESPRATVDGRIRDSYFFNTLADLFKERPACKYVEFEYKRRLSLDRNLRTVGLNMEYLTVFKYIYKPFDTLFYASVSNGIACFDLMAGTLEFHELTELPEVPKEPFGAEHIWYLLYQLPFRHSREPSEWEYHEGESSGYHFDDKTGFDDVPSTWRRPPCPAGTDFTGGLCIVTFDLNAHQPIAVGLDEVKGTWYLTPRIQSVIDNLNYRRMPETSFEVLSRKVVYGKVYKDTGIFVEYDGPLTERFQGQDLPDALMIEYGATGTHFVVGNVETDATPCIRIPVPDSDNLLKNYVETLYCNEENIEQLFLNPAENEGARRMFDLIIKNPDRPLYDRLPYPLNIRLRLIEGERRRFISTLDVPHKFGAGEIAYRKNIFCPADYAPAIDHFPVTLKNSAGKEKVAYPLFECEEFCVYMTRDPKSTQQNFFLMDRDSQTFAEAGHPYRFGYCKALGAGMQASKRLENLILEVG